MLDWKLRRATDQTNLPAAPNVEATLAPDAGSKKLRMQPTEIARG